MLCSIVLVGGSLALKSIILHRWFSDTLQHQAAYGFVFAPSFGIYVISIIYRKIIDGIKRERIQKEKQAAQLAAELKFLRSQINPHFLFNTLTNLVSLARKKSDKLETALIQLSDLMRYMIYDTQDKKVTLQSEIDYLENYISLQQLRFDEDIHLDMQIDVASQVAENLFIEPMLLIPFVENAFKHGTGVSEKSEISIHLAVVQNKLNFSVTNFADVTARPVSKDSASGIGLANVKARLKLLYQHTHSLDIEEKGGWFSINLTLVL